MMSKGRDFKAHARGDRQAASGIKGVGGDEELLHLDAAVHALGDLRERFAFSNDVGEGLGGLDKPGSEEKKRERERALDEQAPLAVGRSPLLPKHAPSVSALGQKRF